MDAHLNPMRYFTGLLLATALAEPLPPTGTLPAWARPVVWVISLVCSSAVGTLIWVKGIRPMIDRFNVESAKRSYRDHDDLQLESFKRREPDYRDVIRTVSMKADLERTAATEKAADAALELAKQVAAGAEAQRGLIAAVERSQELVTNHLTSSTDLVTGSIGRLEGEVGRLSARMAKLPAVYSGQGE